MTHHTLAHLATWFGAAALAVSLGACGDDAGGWDLSAAPASGEGGNGVWETQTTYSPTGTTLVPDGSGFGYDVVDETCGARDLAGWADRFRTPMYRDIVFGAGTLAYLVDGTNLWTVDLSDPAAPLRLGVQPLLGHPVALHYTPTRLWVATIDSGLRGYALAPDGLVVPNDVQVLLRDGDRRVVDVTGDDGALYVALGDQGLAVVPLDDAGRAVAGAAELHVAGPFANAVEATDDGQLAVASCDRVQLYERLAPRVPGGRPDVRALADFAIPFGSAKHVTGLGGELYVSAGEALQVYRYGAQSGVRYLGYYRDPEPGFYVNEAVAGQGYLYIAAGDQSVRAVGFGDLTPEDGVPVTWDEPGDAELSMPEELDMAEMGLVVRQQIFMGDPIGIGLHDDHVYSLGNFRYLGERTIAVFDVSTPAWLKPAGSYVQPNVGIAISKMGSNVVVHATDGTHHVVAGAATGSPFEQTTFGHEPTLNGTVGAGEDLYMYGPGGAVRATPDGGQVRVEQLTDGDVDATSFALDADRGYVADAASDSILVVDLETTALVGTIATRAAFLGDAELWVQGTTLLAYDRVVGEIRSYDTTAGDVPALVGVVRVGECEAYDIADFYSGAKNARARFLTAGPGQDVALLCPRDEDGGAELIELAVAADGTASVAARVELPGEVFTDAVITSDAVLIASFDNNAYTSTVTRVARADGRVLRRHDFLGRANAVLVDGDRTYVVDGDFGLRVLDAKLRPVTDSPLPL